MIIKELQKDMRPGRAMPGAALWRLMTLFAAAGTFLYTTVGDLHEESHAHEEEPHEECLVCQIFHGSIDPTSPEPIQIAVLQNHIETAVTRDADPVDSVGFWMVISARPPPAVV